MIQATKLHRVITRVDNGFQRVFQLSQARHAPALGIVSVNRCFGRKLKQAAETRATVRHRGRTYAIEA